MTNKTFTMLSFAVLALLVLTSFASATVTLSATTPATLLQTTGAHTFDVTVTNTGAGAENAVILSAPTITVNAKTITFTNTTPTDFAIGASHVITMTYTVQDGFNFEMKQYTNTLTAGNTATPSLGTSTLTFAQTDFCAWNGNGVSSTTADLEVSVEDIKVKSGFGEDNEWYPEDEVEVEVKIENKNDDYDIDNIQLEWGLFDEDTGEWAVEVDEQENDFSLKDGEDNTIIFTIKLDDLDEDFEDLGDNLVLYVRATGDVDDDAGEYTACASASEDISMTIESDFVVLSNVQLPETNGCGSQVDVKAEVWNIGDSDQDDVYVLVYNKELGISQKVTIGDIDAFDNVEFNAVVSVPQNAEEKTYTLEFSVFDEDGEVYESGNDDASKTVTQLKVEGGCSTTPLVAVTANLESEEVKAGQELVVKATIVNTGSVKKTFTLELSGYEEWASEAALDKTSVTLNAGASQEVVAKLMINKDASGENSFNIEVVDGAKVLSQPVTVALEEAPSFLSGLTGLVTGTGSNNWYLWGIGALNVILVVVIIFVAIKAVKKK